MLSDRCQSCVSVVSVTLMYCGQTVELIKIKLGMRVGLGSGHIRVRREPSSPVPQRGNSAPILARICCGQMAGWITMPLGMEVGLGPGDNVLDGDTAPQTRGTAPNFRPMSIVAKRLDAPGYHLVWR